VILRKIVFAGAVLGAAILSCMPLVAQAGSAHEGPLVHAALILLGVAAGLALGERADRGAAGWLWLAVLAPLGAIALLVPQFQTAADASPWLHTLQNLVMVALALVAAYAGQRYLHGVGWAVALVLETTAVLASLSFGSAAMPNLAASPAEIARGEQLYGRNCASCHGAMGEGGLGPPLRNEASRRDFRQTQAWIEKPLAPMPALYPHPLGAEDVSDVAAFVMTLR
jgi:mono/diheme cytochrome c family protein